MKNKDKRKSFVGKFFLNKKNANDVICYFIKGISNTQDDWLIYDFFHITSFGKKSKNVNFSYNVEGFVPLSDKTEINSEEYEGYIKIIQEVLQKLHLSYSNFTLSPRIVLTEKIR